MSSEFVWLFKHAVEIETDHPGMHRFKMIAIRSDGEVIISFKYFSPELVADEKAFNETAFWEIDNHLHDDRSHWPLKAIQGPIDKQVN